LYIFLPLISIIQFIVYHLYFFDHFLFYYFSFSSNIQILNRLNNYTIIMKNIKKEILCKLTAKRIIFRL